MRSLVLVVALLCVAFDYVNGHGMMIDPPNRSSVWRFHSGFPANYNDNENFCGGFQVFLTHHQEPHQISPPPQRFWSVNQFQTRERCSVTQYQHPFPLVLSENRWEPKQFRKPFPRTSSINSSSSGAARDERGKLRSVRWQLRKSKTSCEREHWTVREGTRGETVPSWRSRRGCNKDNCQSHRVLSVQVLFQSWSRGGRQC